MGKQSLIVIFTLGMFAILGSSYGQNLPSMSMSTALTSLQDLKREELTGFTKSATGEYRAIDEKEYIVDSGDEFVIKIDIPGPDLKTYYSKVTSDGYLLIPEASGWNVRGLKLFEAKEKIKNNLRRNFPDSQIEVYLEKIRPINVHLTGALQKIKEQPLNSACRLNDLMSALIVSYQSDSLLNIKLAQASLRNTTILRKNQSSDYDFLRYYLLGDNRHNPYLQDGDQVVIPFRDTTSSIITVAGAVSQPIKFEYKQGDQLNTALEFAGGVGYAADSNRIEIYRYKPHSNDFQLIYCRLPKDEAFHLVPDDRIFVRRKAEFHADKYVKILGEVLYPGIYPIVDNQTKLSEIVKQAGGVTKNASLRHSRIYRELGVPGGSELYKLVRAMPFSMSLEWIEANFWRSSAKENLSIVTCDFEGLFLKNEASQDVELKHLDVIVISPVRRFVFVTGAVVYPGTVPYNPDWKFDDYIKASGGYKERARKTRIKVIKHNTETWLDAKETVKIEAGDRIFIPQNEQKEPWDLFMQSLTITTQIITIILVLRTIR